MSDNIKCNKKKKMFQINHIPYLFILILEDFCFQLVSHGVPLIEPFWYFDTFNFTWNVHHHNMCIICEDA